MNHAIHPYPKLQPRGSPAKPLSGKKCIMLPVDLSEENPSKPSNQKINQTHPNPHPRSRSQQKTTVAVAFS